MDNDYYGDWANQVIVGYFYVTLKRSDFAKIDEVENNE